MGKTAVLGAGGKTGKACVQTLLEQGSAVRAVVRDVSKYKDAFGPENTSLEVVQGDVTDPKTLTAQLAGCESTIFAASGTTYWSAKDVDCLGVKNTCDAAKQAGVKHIVLVSSCLVTSKNRLHPIRILLNNIRWSLMDYKFKGEEHLRQSGINYTVIRPGGLTDGPAGMSKLIARQGDSGAGRVSRADVAAVCVHALTDPQAVDVTMELVSEPEDKAGGGVAPLKDQLDTLFQGLKNDGTS